MQRILSEECRFARAVGQAKACSFAKKSVFRLFRYGQRGYMCCIVTDEHWTTDMRTIDQTDRPGGQTSKSTSFIFESGKIGTQRA